MNLVFDTNSPGFLPETTDGFLPFKTGNFKKLYNQSKAPTRGAKPQVIGLAPQQWQMSFASDVLNWPDANALMTVLESYEGGTILFKAWHPQLRFPQKYRASGFAGLTRSGGGAFDGNCNITSAGVNRRTLEVSNLPGGFKFTLGDMISVPFSDDQLLFRILADATANPGGIVTISITPTLPLAFSVGETPPVATVFKPWCFASIDADSIDGPLEGNTGTVSFTAVST